MKTYFAVSVHERKIVIDGVTSIVPNLNGVLIRTNNRNDFQIDKYELEKGLTLNIEYYDPCMEIPDEYEYIDCTQEL